MNSMPVIGIHPDRTGQESYSDKWAEFLTARGVDVRTLNLLAPDALQQAQGCDGIMWRRIHTPQSKQTAQRILYVIEHYLGIPVFPNSATAWHYDEKIAQFYLLQALEAPTPQTWLFWNQDDALAWAHTAPYPVVFKLSAGAAASNVLKVETEAHAVELIHRAFCHGFFSMTMGEYRKPGGLPRSRRQARAAASRLQKAVRYVWDASYPALHPVWWKPEFGYAYFQEFLPGNDFDTRITVIGERAFGLRRVNRPGDFRASGSGRKELDPAGVDLRCIEIAFDISARGNFQSMCYDFLYLNGEPVVSEISYTSPDRTLHNCPGHWVRDLRWVEGHMWPEEAQVEDFLRQIEAG